MAVYRVTRTVDVSLTLDEPPLAEGINAIVRHAFLQGVAQGRARHDHPEGLYADWRGHGPGSQLPAMGAHWEQRRAEGAAKAKADQLAAEIMSQPDDEDDVRHDDPEVCITHLRHVPCRARLRSCETSDLPMHVSIVRAYQSDALSWINARTLVTMVTERAGRNRPAGTTDEAV